MFRLYSKGCEDAIRCLIELSKDLSEERISPTLLCEKAGVKESYTRKALQALSVAKILDASTGPNGGYRLAQKPKEITVISIIEAVDGKDWFDLCVMGWAECDHNKPCPLHHTWVNIKQKMLVSLHTTTLDTLSKDER